MLLEGQEESLVSRLQKREPKAWKEFYDFYSSSLTYVCMRYIIKQEDVQDILQDSLVKMYHAIEKFEYKGKGALQAWATRIVVNESLKFLRKEKYNFTVDEELIEDVVEEETSDFEGVSQEDIFEMIRSLPDGYRAVFNLYVFEQKSHKEIGQLLGIAENSSASQFHRAKGILSQRIKEFKKLKVAL
ncbi:RNA polymerase sigma factor [Myroides pelagicus]|uniref:Sigma-70 family RNA polymerase sigma factor n=1 Tax=Myroides pelagicus TaxID=270914 RepID=A0A7K1GGV3_9FLAO|nr:sigma-70 family RNA polymerase sigma factor [Myroides pelagicus]MEC4113471.1 sigma-70 family RNA polymerase sigma factor [Myroides pelagicus]MTH28311.1 sigma-70 family RNA polymerase sigma factor [Myroides pelagicus]